MFNLRYKSSTSDIMWWLCISVTVALAFLLCIEKCYGDEIDDILPALIKVESNGDPYAISDKGAIGICQITPIVLKEYNTNVGNTERAYREGYQIMHDEYCGEYIPTHIEDYNVDDMYDSHRNKLVAEWYLRRLRDRYFQNISITVSRGAGEIYVEEYCIANIVKSGDGTRIKFENGNFINIKEYRLIGLDDVKLALTLAAWNGGITRLRECNYDINKMPRETRQFVKRVMSIYKEGKGRP